jgi:hypothetical protein
MIIYGWLFIIQHEIEYSQVLPIVIPLHECKLFQGVTAQKVSPLLLLTNRKPEWSFGADVYALSRASPSVRGQVLRIWGLWGCLLCFEALKHVQSSLLHGHRYK